jgi:hypothetical protein
LNRYGGVGEMIALDLKLIFRNKRPRSLVILSVIILLYGFIFYPRYIASGSDSMLFMFALIINGIFIGNYGQFLFAWQSSHFDGMMSFNLNMEQYIRAKFALFLTVGTLQFLVMCLYGLMSWRLLPIQSAAFLYSIGVNSFVTIYAATFNYKYLDLRRSASFNFQGIGAAQWLQSLLIMFAPALLFYVLNRFFGFWIATACISFIGMTGLALNGMIISWLAGEFNLRKHKILEGFREDKIYRCLQPARASGAVFPPTTGSVDKSQPQCSYFEPQPALNSVFKFSYDQNIELKKKLTRASMPSTLTGCK